MGLSPKIFAPPRTKLVIQLFIISKYWIVALIGSLAACLSTLRFAGVVCCGVVLNGVVRNGVVLSGVVWCGVVVSALVLGM